MPDVPRIFTWRQWFGQHGLQGLCCYPDEVWDQPWSPTEQDRTAAWELYTEMRSRISTQPLHYRSGDETTALESIFKLFGTTRELIRKHGPACRHFATITIEVLNVSIRPFTARWHKLSLAGRLDSDDVRHEFRGELTRLQVVLRDFLRLLGLISERDAFVTGSESGFRTINQRQVSLGTPIPFNRLEGLSTGLGVDPTRILEVEQKEVRDRRSAVLERTDLDDLVGLSISGGGIRSATFAIGVLQGIAARGLLKEVDLLSTVSGGGYVGSFLSSYLNDAASPKQSRVDVGPGRDKLPFRRHENCESGALRYLRNHSKYLLPTSVMSRLTMIGQGLYGVLMNLVILSSLPMLAVMITHYCYEGAMRGIAEVVRKGQPFPFDWRHFTVTLCFAAIWGVLVFFLPLVQKLLRLSPTASPARSWYETICAGMFGATFLVGLVESIPVGYYLFLRLNAAFGILSLDSLAFNQGGFWALLANVLAFLSARGLLRRPSEVQVTERRGMSLIRKLAIVLLTLAGPLLVVVLYYLLTHILLVKGSIPVLDWGPLHVGPELMLWMLLLLPLMYTWAFLNVNTISPQRFYRNRLAETFLLKPLTTGDTVHSVDPQKLSELGRTEKAPYHLINGALNLPASRIPELRGRDADFFLFSKHFCGSPISGYWPTKEWEAVDGFLDLGTAVAISGAAVSPHMAALAPRGASFFLTLLNVRLGYWLRRPHVGISPSPFIKALGGPNPWYLFREMFGWINENGRFLNVSDGGHIENLAIYELLRRRCKFIVAIDGECDPRFEFPGLMKLQQYAWIDFGASVELELERLRLTNRGWSQAHIAFGKITYHSGECGFLLYIKLSLTGNERDYLLDYRLRNSPFPHQSTVDQLFDESQFEAYRALGEHMTEDLLCEEFIGKLDRDRDLTIREWFQGLANNLLQDSPFAETRASATPPRPAQPIGPESSTSMAPQDSAAAV